MSNHFLFNYEHWVICFRISESCVQTLSKPFLLPTMQSCKTSINLISVSLTLLSASQWLGFRWPDPAAGQGGRGHWSKGRWQGWGRRGGALSSICAALHCEPRWVVASASATSAVAQTKAGRTYITQTAAACEGRVNGQSAGSCELGEDNTLERRSESLLRWARASCFIWPLAWFCWFAVKRPPNPGPIVPAETGWSQWRAAEGSRSITTEILCSRATIHIITEWSHPTIDAHRNIKILIQRKSSRLSRLE